MDSKVCSKCNIEKPLSAFRKPSKVNAKYGHPWCYDCLNVWRRSEYSRYPERYRRASKIYNETHPHRTWARVSVRNHKMKGYDVRFNYKQLEELALKTPACLFCGEQINYNRRGKIYDDSPSLENLNNEKIITLENSTIICYSCNRTKARRSVAEFFEYIEKVMKRKEMILASRSLS